MEPEGSLPSSQKHATTGHYFSLFHTLPPYFITIHFYIILVPTSKSSEAIQAFQAKFCTHFSSPKVNYNIKQYFKKWFW
jgi:hypothetical protein